MRRRFGMQRSFRRSKGYSHYIVKRKKYPRFLLIGGAYMLFILLLFIILPLSLGGREAKQADFSESPQMIFLIDGEPQQMALEEFLIGVVAAEMPASFPEDALAAQSVAARSYICVASPLLGGSNRHGEAVVCNDPSCCQAWISEEERAARWGEKAEENSKKIISALKKTYGNILTYEGEPVSSPYFSTCGGMTESAANVWGNDCPWLISVECDWDSEAPSYISEAEFSLKEAAEILDVSVPAVSTMTVISQTSGGRVAEVDIGGERKSGSEMRTIFGLKSTSFTIEAEGDKIMFSVKGYGHGVGLCQYGSGGMAKAGYSFEEILDHYYTDTKLKKIY